MGLRGRRVHMIEEMTEAVISFQRVVPGARERLVQITGKLLYSDNDLQITVTGAMSGRYRLQVGYNKGFTTLIELYLELEEVTIDYR